MKCTSMCVQVSVGCGRVRHLYWLMWKPHLKDIYKIRYVSVRDQIGHMLAEKKIQSEEYTTNLRYE